MPSIFFTPTERQVIAPVDLNQYAKTMETLQQKHENTITQFAIYKQALANLDIYEQNVRIQTLNYERTKAMFDEGLKSKIDVVNAEVNLADAKIQLVEGQNSLLNAVIALENSMYYQEEKPFVVKNTEGFNFLKADYKKKFDSDIEIILKYEPKSKY